MYFPVSAAIATDLPAVSVAIEELDRLIYQTGDHPLRASATADFLGVQLPVVSRLLKQFVERGVLRPDQGHYCRRCDMLLEDGDDGFWCDACECVFASADTHAEQVFFAVDPIIRVDVEPDDDVVATIPLVIQFIAGDRGGPQTAQIQAPREHREISESLARSTYRRYFTMVSPIFAATATEIASSYVADPGALHFAGHGDDRSLSVIQDRGILVNSQPLTATQLQQMLINFPARIRLCLLNTCHSHEIANTLAHNSVVDIAIGWNGQVPDHVAIDFAAAFYRHLGEGLSYGQAFGLAQACCPPGSAQVHLYPSSTIVPTQCFAVQTRRPS